MKGGGSCPRGRGDREPVSSVVSGSLRPWSGAGGGLRSGTGGIPLRGPVGCGGGSGTCFLSKPPLALGV